MPYRISIKPFSAERLAVLNTYTPLATDCFCPVSPLARESLSRVTLKTQEDIDLFSARDALVLKALSLVITQHLSISRQEVKDSSSIVA